MGWLDLQGSQKKQSEVLFLEGLRDQLLFVLAFPAQEISIKD